MNVVGYNNRLWTNLHVINRVEADIPRKFLNSQYNIKQIYLGLLLSLTSAVSFIIWTVAVVKVSSYFACCYC